MLFKIWLFQLERTEAMLKKTVSDCLWFEDRLETGYRSQSNSNPNNFSPKSNPNPIHHSDSMWKRASHRFEVDGLPILSKTAAVMFGTVSVAVIWSEAMIIFDYF